MTPEGNRPSAGTASYQGEIEACLEAMQASDVIGRMWRKDHTLWKPSPAEIIDRLGWLDLPWRMRQEVPALEALGREVRNASVRYVVLLGMGGSSLAPEVLRSVFGSAEGYPQLIVLDSTIPAAVRAVGEAIDPCATLFLVSSKSGSTIEPNCLYAHFREVVEQSCGSQAGDSFLAITDVGTPLDRLAVEAGFRRVFRNPPDVGGRYSALSYFGLVPAALMGADVGKLLDGAIGMAEACGPGVPLQHNPGAWLGAAMALMVLRGRDKLALVASPAIAGFGLWVEQLLAESVGKEGVGIIPVIGEPSLAIDDYGPDRHVVYLRLEGDDAADALMSTERLSPPVARIDLPDKHALGGEFYRWETATAVAGHLLGIHPFDQPDVQAAKDATDAMLACLQQTGSLPPIDAPSSLAWLLSDLPPGGYAAILAYCRQTPETDRSLASLQSRIARKHKVAVTMGYGPRYLHSTGQLHKGGPACGVYLMLMAREGADMPIAGRPYTFGQLAQAQAQGDLRALQAAGRRVAWVDLGEDTAGRIDQLADQVG